MTNYDKIQNTDTTIIKPLNDAYLLPEWTVIFNDFHNNGKARNFKRATKTNSPTGYSGSKSLPPVGTTFVYIETSSINHGNNVFVSFERTDIIQISNIIIYYNRFSILTNDSLKSMGGVRRLEFSCC